MFQRLLALTFLFCQPALASDTPQPIPFPEPLMSHHDISPLIYNGTRSLPGEFPAMGWIGNCTGTLVAPNVLLTAAHCVTNGKRISFAHRGTGRSYAATCQRHPRVNTSTWFNDYAFCKLDQSVPEGSVMASFENRTPAVGERLLLNGLGAPNVRVHFWGQASVRRISGQDIVTCGPANLGGGDSGGSLLAWTEDRRGGSGYRVLGVNSRGGGGCSYFNRISHNDFQSWAVSYERSQGVSLCGISRVCAGQPPEPPSDDECQDGLDVAESCAFGPRPDVASCNEAIDTLKKCSVRPL